MFKYPGSHAPKKQVVYARGSYGSIDNKAAFNQAYTDASYGSETLIVGRACANCEAAYRQVFYKRIRDPASFSDPYTSFTGAMTATNNVLNVDYEFYGTLADAVKGNNKYASSKAT